MLRKAHARVRKLGLSHVEGLAVMDAERMAFPHGSFDVIVAQYVITTVPNPEATLDEFARVLKPGGEIVLISRVGAEAGLRCLLERWFAPGAGNPQGDSETAGGGLDRPFPYRDGRARRPPRCHFSLREYVSVDLPTPRLPRRRLKAANTWGKTYEEAVMHAEEALAVYLETFDELGKSIPEEMGQKQAVSLGVTVRVPVIV
jgi:SAM-dependent methyltransferase